MSIRGGNARPTILLVEDDEADVFFFRRCLSVLGADVDLRIVENAWLARNYLEGVAQYSDRRYYPLPQLIIADMNLNGATALDLVRWIRLQPKLENIPYLVYTGAISPADEERLRGVVTAVYRKSGNFAEARQVVAQILQHLPAL